MDNSEILSLLKFPEKLESKINEIRADKRPTQPFCPGPWEYLVRSWATSADEEAERQRPVRRAGGRAARQ
eukprot:9420503-Heterocapsa_arctica.AAC.1